MTEPNRTPELSAALVRLVRDAVMDPELAGLLWMTVEGGIPAVVAGGTSAERLAVRDGLRTLVPSSVSVVPLDGPDEDFAWMPEAGELGWRASGPMRPALPGAVMLGQLEGGEGETWGEAAHLAIRALTVGYSLLATAAGASLEDVLGRLALPPVSAIDDELTRLGVVLIIGDGPRVGIAHYLRPVARDPGGHVQRMPPAALAAWNGGAGRFDHFAWGVTPELAGRTGQRPIAFEREQARRASAIARAATGP